MYVKTVAPIALNATLARTSAFSVTKILSLMTALVLARKGYSMTQRWKLVPHANQIAKRAPMIKPVTRASMACTWKEIFVNPALVIA